MSSEYECVSGSVATLSVAHAKSWERKKAEMGQIIKQYSKHNTQTPYRSGEGKQHIRRNCSLKQQQLAAQYLGLIHKVTFRIYNP